MTTISTYTATIMVLEYQSTETAETGTTEQTVSITDHGLATGDFIVNISQRATTQLLAERGSRKVTVVDDDTFTVSPVITGQTISDSIMLFSFTDRTYQLMDGSLNLNMKGAGQNNASFIVNASKGS